MPAFPSQVTNCIFKGHLLQQGALLGLMGATKTKILNSHPRETSGGMTTRTKASPKSPMQGTRELQRTRSPGSLSQDGDAELGLGCFSRYVHFRETVLGPLRVTRRKTGKFMLKTRARPRGKSSRAPRSRAAPHGVHSGASRLRADDRAAGRNQAAGATLPANRPDGLGLHQELMANCRF